MSNECGNIFSAKDFIARRGISFDGDVSQRVPQPKRDEPRGMEENISFLPHNNSSDKEKKRKEIALIRMLLRSPRYQMFDKNVWRYHRYNWNKA